MKGVFVTGTGTDVGKTRVTGLVLGALRNAGVDAVTIKPVQTGCAPGAIAPDLEEHWRLSGWRPSNAGNDYAPLTFRDPVSPHLAARNEKRSIQLDTLILQTRAIALRHAFALVEGAGGVLVPLNERETMLDFMRALGLPVLVVGAAGVGTINHTLLTLSALSSAKVAVSGVVLNATVPVDEEVSNDNARTIALFSHVPVFGTVAFGAKTAADLPVELLHSALALC